MSVPKERSRLNLPIGTTDMVTALELNKDKNGSLGFDIDGGMPLCPLIYVTHVISGSEAEQKGMEVGDRILMANNIEVESKTLTDCAQMLRGLSSPAQLSIVRFRGTLDYAQIMSTHCWDVDANELWVSFNQLIGRDLEKELKVRPFLQEELTAFEDYTKSYRGALLFFKQLEPLQNNYSESLVEYNCAGSMLGFTMAQKLESEPEFRILESNIRDISHRCFTMVQKITEVQERLDSVSAPVLKDFKDAINKFELQYRRYLALSVTLHDMQTKEEIAKLKKASIDRCWKGNIYYRFLLQKRYEQKVALSKTKENLQIKHKLLLNIFFNRNTNSSENLLLGLRQFYEPLSENEISSKNISSPSHHHQTESSTSSSQ